MPFHPSQLRVNPGDPEPLRHHRTDATLGLGDRATALQKLADLLPQLRELHDRLYAQRTWSLLVILQAMDAAGKDGIVKHVLAGFNQQSCHVSAFGPPAGAELSHTFLWRCVAQLPARGQIGVFNRSYYEEVLVPRVHPDYIGPQRLPGACLAADPTRAANAKHLAAAKPIADGPKPAAPNPKPKTRNAKLDFPSREFWQGRFDDINAFERHLVRNGTHVVKLFLNLSPEEQKKRFLVRINDPARNWKFSPNDARDRRNWQDYHQAYNEMLSATSTPWAPWHILPADHKYVARLAAGLTLQHELRALHPQFPRLDPAAKHDLSRAKALLEREK